MQNVRSKSMTPACSSGPVLPFGVPAWQAPREASGLGGPVCRLSEASGPKRPASRLRPVPGRIALFVVVVGAVAMLLLPRLVAAASPPVEEQTHVVEKGDTLWGVATRNAAGGDPRDYVDRLRIVNRLSSPQISPGQTLILP